MSISEKAREWCGFVGLTLREQETLMRIAPGSASAEVVRDFLQRLKDNSIASGFELDLNKARGLIDSVNKRRQRVTEQRAKSRGVTRTSQTMPGGAPRNALESLRLQGII